jgi:hypothetical protein
VTAKAWVEVNPWISCRLMYQQIATGNPKNRIGREMILWSREPFLVPSEEAVPLVSARPFHKWLRW